MHKRTGKTLETLNILQWRLLYLTSDLLNNVMETVVFE